MSIINNYNTTFVIAKDVDWNGEGDEGSAICSVCRYGEIVWSSEKEELFEIVRCYGVHGHIVMPIERIYDCRMVKFEMDDITTEWSKSESGVRQGCPLSPLLYIMYVGEFCNCVHGCLICSDGKE